MRTSSMPVAGHAGAFLIALTTIFCARAAMGDEAALRSTAERIRRNHEVVLDWQKHTLSSLMDAEARLNAAERIRRNHKLVLDWQKHTLFSLMDAEARLNTTERIRRNHKVVLDWQEETLSTLLAKEASLTCLQPMAAQSPLRSWATDSTAIDRSRVNGTILPGRDGGMVIGGPMNGTILPGRDGGMVIGGPMNGTILPGFAK